MKDKFTSYRQRIKTWRIPKILRNKYIFTIFVFGVWMTFFDQNNIFVQYGRYHDLKEAENESDYYIVETKKTKVQLDELLTNESSLEKYAREKYYMKKPNEDVFVIVKK